MSTGNFNQFLNDPYARTFVLPRNLKFERNCMQERATYESQRGGAQLPVGSAQYANNHAIPLPGGQIYLRSGISTTDMAQRTSQYANRF